MGDSNWILEFFCFGILAHFFTYVNTLKDFYVTNKVCILPVL